MEFKIDNELKSLIPALTKDEYSRLESSILKEGCRDKLIVWGDILVDGHNRYEICTKHNIEFDIILKEFDTIEQVKTWMLINQLGRRNLTPEKFKYFIGKLYNESKKQGERTDLTSGQNVQKSKQIAEEYKINEKTVRRAAKFAEAIDNIAEECGVEIKDDILNREIDLSQKDTLRLAQDENKKEIVDILKEDEEKDYSDAKLELYWQKEPDIVKTPKLSIRNSEIIYADPPWRYDFSVSETREIENQYPTMTVEQIKNIDIPTNKDSILFIWATAPKLRECLEVIEAWGFEYKTHAIWDKEIIGMGYWFRGQHELLIVATKGKASPPLPELRISSIIKEKRTEHSKKPNLFYELIEKWYPGKKYIELFAREKREGWESWGLEVNNE